MPQPVSFSEHAFKNISLICLSILFLPIDTFVVAACFVWQAVRPFLHPREESVVRQHEGPRRTVLVSSLAMGKGLSLARAFHAAGHRVIGVDFDTSKFAHSPVWSPGRFSKALHKYYTVTTPNNGPSGSRYVQDMVNLIKSERAELWVCVSGVASTIEDTYLKDIIEKETKCMVFQLDPRTCEVLHDKHKFIRTVNNAGLKTPTTVFVESREEVFRVLEEHPNTTFILKCVPLDDVSRADITQIPQPTPQQTGRFVNSLDISPQKPWVVQQYISGAEFCTHAVVVRGEVKSFVACPSSEMLMHYESLAGDAPISKAMLAFTRRLVRTLEEGKMTGQVSFDFIIDIDQALGAKSPLDIDLYPIECNPRTHTAVVLLAENPRELAAAYLSLLDEPRKTSRSKKNGQHPEPYDDTDVSTVIYPNKDSFSRTFFYWMGHDFVTEVALPVLDMLTLKMRPADCGESVAWFLVRLISWKDGTFEVEDPVPWWWLYHIYYPWLFATSLLTGKRWSRVNVSTTRMFES
jgi:catechol O-methyltransferase